MARGRQGQPGWAPGTRLRQFASAAGPQDERNTDLVLQLAQLTAQRRLGEPQMRGGLGKAPGFSDIDEIPQGPQVRFLLASLCRNGM